jgi:OHCU decarboxylase
MPPLDATAALLRCCGSSRWTAAMVGARPFENAAALARIAERVWWSLGEADYLEAFGAHPKIGEASAAKWSQQEQAGAGGASSETLAALVDANREYADKHGFIYIVCASSRSADEMLADVQARKRNGRDAEVRRAAEEQAKITRLRLAKLLEELAR